MFAEIISRWQKLPLAGKELRLIQASNANPDEILHSEEFQLDFHCLHNTFELRHVISNNVTFWQV